MLGSSISSYIYPIIYQLEQCLLAIRDWFMAFLQSIFSANSSIAVLAELKPLAVISIAVSIILVAIHLIKKVVWGS